MKFSAEPQETIVAEESDTSPEKGRKGAFSSLKNRNFRLLWIGGVLSHIGDEMQFVAVSWLVMVITNSPALMGVASFFQGLPRLFFGFAGGVIADRSNRHRLLILYQGTEMIFSFFFAFLVLTGRIKFWHVLVLLPIFGFLKSVYQVCRNAYFFDLVGKEDLMNALAIHSSGMNFGKIVGPSIAGLLIGFLGVGWCLLINGLSFIPILLAMFAMEPPKFFKKKGDKGGILREMVETFLYFKKDWTILMIMAASFGFTVFGLQVQVILPLFARNVLQVGASGFGFLMAAMGAGAIVSGVSVATLGDIKHKGRFLISAYIAYSALLIAFSLSSWFFLSLVVIFLVGFVDMFSKTINQTLVQLLAPNELRGRVLGVYTLDKGMKPLGGFMMGAAAGFMGAPLALSVGAGICMFVALSLFFKAPRIKEL